MDICRAREGDSRELEKIILEEFSYTMATQKKVLQRIRSKSIFVHTARQGKEIVGFSDIEVLDAMEGTMRLNALAVKKGARNMGIGAKILGSALAFARSLGAKKMVLLVRPDNFAAKRVYQKAGFKNRGIYGLIDEKPAEEMEIGF